MLLGWKHRNRSWDGRDVIGTADGVYPAMMEAPPRRVESKKCRLSFPSCRDTTGYGRSRTPHSLATRINRWYTVNNARRDPSKLRGGVLITLNPFTQKTRHTHGKETPNQCQSMGVLKPKRAVGREAERGRTVLAFNAPHTRRRRPLHWRCCHRKHSRRKKRAVGQKAAAGGSLTIRMTANESEVVTRSVE